MVRHRFHKFSTTFKLVLIFSLAVLPLVLFLVWGARSALDQAKEEQLRLADEQSRAAARAIEDLTARNILALRIAASGALNRQEGDYCATAANSLRLTTGIGQSFSIRDENGKVLCRTSDFKLRRDSLRVVSGVLRLWVEPETQSLYFRAGFPGGMVTGALPRQELAAAAVNVAEELQKVAVTDGRSLLSVIDRPPGAAATQPFHDTVAIAGNHLRVRTTGSVPIITVQEQLLIMLPLALWLVAVLLIWALVHWLLIRPLRGLQRSIAAYRPGEEPMVLPERLGPAAEIQDVGMAFANAAQRVDESEAELIRALEGQRRLVREVHHRVKNNLQVVASLLSIHGRNAATRDSQSAYAAIGRRVDALSVVHRNHFAEGEENRGIALRPMLTELAAGLRASAPDDARRFAIALDSDDLRTTQDAAVAAAFLVTEVVEYSMMRAADQPLEIVLSRISELTGRLSLSSAVLVPERDDDPEQKQFERIVGGLARQLRSPLERILGRYSVEIPVFPDS